MHAASTSALAYCIAAAPVQSSSILLRKGKQAPLLRGRVTDVWSKCVCVCGCVGVWCFRELGVCNEQSALEARLFANPL
jgi:hypothetical protein